MDAAAPNRSASTVGAARRRSRRRPAAIASVAALLLVPLSAPSAAYAVDIEYIEEGDFHLTLEEEQPGSFWLESQRLTIQNLSTETQTWRIGATAWEEGVVEPLWEHSFLGDFAQVTLEPGDPASEHWIPRWPGVDFHLSRVVGGVTEDFGKMIDSQEPHVPVRFDAIDSTLNDFTWQIGREVTTSVDPARAGESIVVRANDVNTAEVGVYFVEESVFVEELQNLHDLSLDPAGGTFATFLGTVPVTGGDVAGLVTIPSGTAPGSYAVILDAGTGPLWQAGPPLGVVSDENGSTVFAHNLTIEAGDPRTLTAVGDDVVVVPVDPATGESVFSFTFDSVVTEGETTVLSTNVLPPGVPAPTSFSVPTDPPVYYLLETTAEFDGQIQLCVRVPGFSEAEFTALDLFHYTDGAWHAIGIGRSYDTDTGVGEICGTTSGLSPFAVGIPTAWPFGGFEQPVKGGDAVNSVKAGSNVPIAFSVGGDRGMDLLADGSPASALVTCGSTAPASSGTPIASPGKSGLKFDAASDTYSVNWKTEKSWKGSCRQLLLMLDDGSTHRAHFRFT